MRSLAQLVALVACLVITGSNADAGGRRHAKVVAPADEDEDEDESDDEEEPEADEAPVTIERTLGAPSRDWQVAIGPYLWASSVDANVSLGPSSVSTGVDFFQMSKHAKYGAEALLDVRYKKLAFSGDVMWGVVGLDGAKEVGPLMVTLNGEASSLLADGMVGYAVVGDERSALAFEPRVGVRYQRTSVSGAVSVGGSDVGSAAQVDAGGDALAGARVVVRPARWFSLAGNADVAVFGSSNATWSASADASVRLSRVQLSLGYRTLMSDRAQVAMTMHGPRIALQLVF